MLFPILWDKIFFSKCYSEFLIMSSDYVIRGSIELACIETNMIFEEQPFTNVLQNRYY